LDDLQRTFPNAPDGLEVIALTRVIRWVVPGPRSAKDRRTVPAATVYRAVGTYLGGLGAGWLLPAIDATPRPHAQIERMAPPSTGIIAPVM
jgi:hypothetical protein